MPLIAGTSRSPPARCWRSEIGDLGLASENGLCRARPELGPVVRISCHPMRSLQRLASLNQGQQHTSTAPTARM
jgi:hypothetical protein